MDAVSVCVCRDSFDDLLPTLSAAAAAAVVACNGRPDVDSCLSDQQQSAADGEEWTAVNRR